MRHPQDPLVLNHELTVNFFCSCKHFFCFLHLLDTPDIINLDYPQKMPRE